MPKKLMDCVARVKASGKSESEAFAICIKSTGLKPHKESELIKRQVKMANLKYDSSKIYVRDTFDGLVVVCDNQEQVVKVQHYLDSPGSGGEVFASEILTDPAAVMSEPEMLITFEEFKSELPIRHETITEPMPGEVPSAEELEKWLKASSRINHLITLANHLDELNLPEEATLLDQTLEKEAQWQWMKEKGQQLKDWYQTEKEPQKQTRRTLTDFRQNHWDLVKKLNTAYQMLVKSHKNIGKPEYLRDITSMINYILKDIQKASAAVQTITTQPAQQPQGQPAAPQGPATPQPPAPPAASVAPGASIASLVERLTRLADKLDAKGNKEAAQVVRAQWQAATEMGQRGMDWMLGRGEGERAQSDKQWSNFHWRVAGAFKSAYDKLNAVRQYLNDPNIYSERFQAVANEIQTDLNTILGEIQNAGKPAIQPATTQPAVQPVDEGEDPFRSPSPDLTKTQKIQPADQVYALMADMTSEQQVKAVELIRQLQGQTP